LVLFEQKTFGGERDGSDRREDSRGSYFLVLGIAIVVAAGLLFGLTTPAGAIDWVSVVTAIAGLGLVVDGLYLVYRNRGTGGRTQPHAGS
jgi:hypothetical protein